MKISLIKEVIILLDILKKKKKKGKREGKNGKLILNFYEENASPWKDIISRPYFRFQKLRVPLIITKRSVKDEWRSAALLNGTARVVSLNRKAELKIRF